MVDGVVDAASATFGVRLELPNPDHEVLAGLACKVEFGSHDAADIVPVPAPPVTAGDPVVAP
jgi:multidrug efflux pump subunit AcrA (membrane-fusion protein)